MHILRVTGVTNSDGVAIDGVGILDVLALEEILLAGGPALNAPERVVKTDAGLLAAHIGHGGQHLEGILAKASSPSIW